MNYGPHDNEISRLFQGSVDPPLVQFDPVEIEGIYYFNLVELLEQMKAHEEAFCNWFIQIIRWAKGQPSELNVLKIQEDVRRPWL
jgi:isopentenyldiphosphate isomerase